MISIGVHVNHIQNFSSIVNFSEKNVYYLVLLAHFLRNIIPGSELRFYENAYYEILNDKFHDTLTIYNQQTKKYVIVDFRDGPYAATNYLSDPNLLGSYASMYRDGLHKLEIEYERSKISHYEFLYKYKPFYFFDQYPNLTRSYVRKISNIRKDKRKLIPKMNFSGTTGTEKGSRYVREDGKGIRNIVKILQEKYPDIIDVNYRHEKLAREDWWLNTSKYILTLTVPGHPWCFREHECWSLGIATIANTYISPLPVPLIPDKHYIDCNTSGKNHMDSEVDDEKSADLIAKRFLSVFKNYSFIESVEKNSKVRYNQFNRPEKAARYLKRELKALRLL